MRRRRKLLRLGARRRRLPITYKGTRPEGHRIQTVINEWLAEQAISGARHTGEVTDGAAGELLVKVVEHFRPQGSPNDAEASAALAEYLREYGWNARA